MELFYFSLGLLILNIFIARNNAQHEIFFNAALLWLRDIRVKIESHPSCTKADSTAVQEIGTEHVVFLEQAVASSPAFNNVLKIIIGINLIVLGLSLGALRFTLFEFLVAVGTGAAVVGSLEQRKWKNHIINVCIDYKFLFDALTLKENIQNNGE